MAEGGTLWLQCWMSHRAMNRRDAGKAIPCCIGAIHTTPAQKLAAPCSSQGSLGSLAGCKQQSSAAPLHHAAAARGAHLSLDGLAACCPIWLTMHGCRPHPRPLPAAHSPPHAPVGAPQSARKAPQGAPGQARAAPSRSGQAARWTCCWRQFRSRRRERKPQVSGVRGWRLFLFLLRTLLSTLLPTCLWSNTRQRAGGWGGLCSHWQTGVQ